MVAKVAFFHLGLYLYLYSVVSSSRLPKDAEKEARGSNREEEFVTYHTSMCLNVPVYSSG